MPFHPAVWCLGSASKTSLRSLKLKTSLTMDKNMPLNRFLFTVGMLFSFKHSQKTKCAVVKGKISLCSLSKTC